MEKQKSILGNGILKQSARALAVYVDANGNSYICDKDEAAKIDRSRPIEEQNLTRCQVMPFDHGG